MKIWFCIVSVVILFAACNTQKNAVKVKKSSEEITVQDSIEYDLETFDSRFESWYNLKNTPSTYRSQSYYENWNRQYVIAWNEKAMGRTKNSIFEPIVGYESNVDYGFELNHRLFYYFQYVEHILKIKILPNSPRVAH